MKYYYANATNETVGPFNMEELKSLATKGEIFPETVIITEETMQYTKYCLLTSSEVISQKPVAEATEPSLNSTPPPSVPPAVPLSPTPAPIIAAASEPTAPAPALHEPAATPAPAPAPSIPDTATNSTISEKQAEAKSEPPQPRPKGTPKRWLFALLGGLAIMGILAAGVIWWNQRPTVPSAKLIESYIDAQLLAKNYKTRSVNHKVTSIAPGQSEVTVTGELLVLKTLYARVAITEHLKAIHGFETGALAQAVARAASLPPGSTPPPPAQAPNFESITLLKVVQESNSALPFSGTLSGNLVNGEWHLNQLEIKGPQATSRDLLHELPAGTTLLVSTPADQAKLAAMVNQATAYISAVNAAVAAENESRQREAMERARVQQALAAQTIKPTRRQPLAIEPKISPKPVEEPKPVSYSSTMPETAAAVLELAQRGVSETVMMLRVRRGSQAESLSPEQIERLRKGAVPARVIEALIDPQKAQFSK